MDEETRRKALNRARESLGSEAETERVLSKTVKQFDGIGNSLEERTESFRDWYSLYFPELESEIEDDREFLKVLDRYGVRRKEIEPFQEMAERSKGSELGDRELDLLEEEASSLSEDLQYRGSLEDYIRETARDEFPNLSAVLNPVLAARVVSLAGGLEELARKPASTVQMMGAEKALFRHLHGNGEPPKHGVLFKHEFVNSLPEDKRGKMARFLANKAVLAARLDNYGEKDRASEYREEASEKYRQLSEN
jgi:nucleolar protein 56